MCPLKILVVDDETAILEYLGGILSSQGHTVYTYAGCSTGTAMKIVETAAVVRFDVAIVDIVMPGIDGLDLIEFVHRVSPCTRFVSTDCGTFLEEVAGRLRERGIACSTLLKPFEAEQLNKLLEDSAPLSGCLPKKAANWLHEDEAALRTEIDRAVTMVVYTSNPHARSFIGQPCNVYASECKAAADFVWRNLPYETSSSAVSKLAELLARELKCKGGFVSYVDMAARLFSFLPSAFRGVQFQVTGSVRPYPRHCSWCSREIAKKELCFVLYGVVKRRPRFCSRDCFENWDSIHWQELALQHSKRADKDAEAEKKQLKRQKTLMGYGW